MARPSRLTDDQCAQIKKRLLAGESYGKLAKEFGVSKATLVTRFSDRLLTVKTVANQLVAADDALNNLPVNDQSDALELFKGLREISRHAIGAGNFGMAIAHRLSGIASGIVERVDDANPLKSLEDLKAVMLMGRIANEHAHIGLNLLAANKERENPNAPPPERRVIVIDGPDSC